MPHLVDRNLLIRLLVLVLLVGLGLVAHAAVECCTEQFPHLVVEARTSVLKPDFVLGNLNVVAALLGGCMLVQLQFASELVVIVAIVLCLEHFLVHALEFFYV